MNLAIRGISHNLGGKMHHEKEMVRIQEEMKAIMKAEKQSQAILEEAFRGLGIGLMMQGVFQ